MNTRIANDRDRLLGELFEAQDTFKCLFFTDVDAMAIRITTNVKTNWRVDVNLYSLPCTAIFMEHGSGSHVWFKYEWWFDYDGNHIKMEEAKEKNDD